MRIPLVLGLFLMSILSEGQKLRVAIASSLLLPFQELEEQFEASSDIDIELISGSSGSLTTQIINGAPYDLFISANQAFPEKLYSGGLTSNQPEVLFSGQVYLWSKSEIGSDLPSFLKNADFRRLAIANPELAPYGTTAKDWLVRSGIWPRLESKMVFGNAIGQVNHYISTSAVDAALSSNSAAFSDQLKNEGYWYAVIGSEIALVPYFYVILNTRDNSMKANDLIEFLFEQEQQDILQKFGFID